MKKIKRFLSFMVLLILSFVAGLLVGKSSVENVNALVYEDGTYKSSNLVNITETSLEEAEGEETYTLYYDSQGEGTYYFYGNEFDELQYVNAWPHVMYKSFEIDETDSLYIDVEWDVDSGYIQFINDLEPGFYTFSFEVNYESFGNYERYFMYNFMLNVGPYQEYEPIGKIYGNNQDIGMFKYANLKRGIFEDIDTINYIETLDYTPVYSGFIAKNWDYEYGRVDYAIIADFGDNGFRFDNYNFLLLLNGDPSAYTTSLRYGQQIYILFENGTYYINGADLSYEGVASIDLKALRADYGRVIYKIVFVGYGEDYIPGGLATDTFYTAGYNDGFSGGKTAGFYEGYEAGSQAGYERGFIDGEAVGVTQSNNALGVARSVLGFVTDFTAIEILPNIRLIYLLGLVVMVSIFKWITGLFK